ncbi:12386_t:CDS:1, partial [Ambispora gerdemannii]
KPQALARQVFVNETLPKSKLVRPLQKYVTNKTVSSCGKLFFCIGYIPEFETINPVVSALPML